MPVRQPSARKETNSTITSASMKECTNSPTACSTTFGWSAIMLDIDALRHRLHEIVGGGLETSLPSSRMLAPLAVTTPMPIAGLPSWRTLKLGGSTKPWRDGGDVAEPEHAAVALDRRFRNRLGAVERAGDAQRHALR